MNGKTPYERIAESLNRKVRDGARPPNSPRIVFVTPGY